MSCTLIVKCEFLTAYAQISSYYISGTDLFRENWVARDWAKGGLYTLKHCVLLH